MPEKFQCPACQKEYRWNEQLAGKRVKCKCGNALTVPAADAPVETDDLGVYDVAESAPPPLPAVSTVAQPRTVAPAAMQTMSYASPAAMAMGRLGTGRRKCCHACGGDAPTRYTEFYQNVGALVVRFHKSVKGELCKKCVHQHFWSMTLTTLAVGWLGYISIIIAPCFIINNIFRYVGCLSLPSSHGDA